MYPPRTYPFFAQLDENWPDYSGESAEITRGEILEITGEEQEDADDVDGEFWAYHDATGDCVLIPYGSVTPLCQVCDDNPAISLGQYHPTTLLCAACLEGEPVPEWDNEENPYDHDSSYNGCAPDCPACRWDKDHVQPQDHNWCDHGHVVDKVRLLPTGGGGNIYVCHRHYVAELRYRRVMEHEHGGEWEYPSWNSLTPYTGV